MPNLLKLPLGASHCPENSADITSVELPNKPLSGYRSYFSGEPTKAQKLNNLLEVTQLGN